MGGRAAALVLAVLILAAAGLAGWWLTPHDHVAGGCFWWTARTVDSVVAGQKGCVRGYFVKGGALATTRAGDEFALSLQPANAPCPFRPGDPVVVRYTAIFDDGRTIVVADDCR